MAVLVPNVYRILYRSVGSTVSLEFFVTSTKPVSKASAQAWLDRTLEEKVIAVSIDQMVAFNMEEEDTCPPT